MTRIRTGIEEEPCFGGKDHRTNPVAHYAFMQYELRRRGNRGAITKHTATCLKCGVVRDIR